MKESNGDIWKKRGAILKDARIHKGLLQKQVAIPLGLKGNTIAGYESGVRHADVDTAVELCKFLDINILDFLNCKSQN